MMRYMVLSFVYVSWDEGTADEGVDRDRITTWIMIKEKMEPEMITHLVAV